jgi:hypothetical protein
MNFQSISIAVKRAKIGYYAKNVLRQIVPTVLYQRLLKQVLANTKYDKEYLAYRVKYYNKLTVRTSVGDNAIALKDVDMFTKFKTYKFDAFEYTRYFKQTLKANFLNGDVNHVNSAPTIQKSRPITGDNANAVILKLDKKRHFFFVKDKIQFADKKDMLIGRAAVSQPHRIKFMEMYFNNPLCDLGQVNKREGKPAWIKPKMAIADHLAYKFILSLEGNDVATNLKWIMSSNSIAIMPAPKYETWFMEGRLIPDHHYIQIRDDYTDLEEKLQYYIEHTAKAQAIINNANAYVKQFFDKKQEDLISLLVLERYFYYTSQKDTLVVL